MDVLKQTYKLKSRDVNMFLRLRTSQLFEIMQEIATDHSELLGAGIEKIRSKNLMWVLARQNVEISRMPSYNEYITIETWPGTTVHSLYPRYYRILDSKGENILNSSSIWILADMKERSLVPSSLSGIAFSYNKRGMEIALPSPPRQFFTDRRFSFSVPFSYIDMNRHMNNTRYFDLADNLSPFAITGRVPKKINVEYSSELLLGNSYDLFYGLDGNRFFLKAGEEKSFFRIVYDY